MQRLSPDYPLTLQVLQSDPSFPRAGAQKRKENDFPKQARLTAKAQLTGLSKLKIRLGPDHRADGWGNASWEEEKGERDRDKQAPWTVQAVRWVDGGLSCGRQG